MMTSVLDAEQHLTSALHQLRGAGNLNDIVAAAIKAMQGVQALLDEVKRVTHQGEPVAFENKRFHCPVLQQELTTRACAVNYTLNAVTCQGCEVGGATCLHLGPEKLRSYMEGVKV